MSEKTKTDSSIVQYKGPIDPENLTDEESQKSPNGPTLLWRSAAKTVSLATGAATASIRAGVSISKWSLNAGRQATYGIIGLNQSAITNLMVAAGTDMNSVSSMYILQNDAEGLIERWLASIHYGFTAVNTMAAMGFNTAEHVLDWTSGSSLMGLTFLNSVFGCTETSKAVAAIISLMKQEYYKPGVDGRPSEISTLNLLTTVASFLFLQRISRRKTEIEWRHAQGDYAVWDVVIDDRGFTADVLGSRRQPAMITSSQSIVQSPPAEESADDFAVIAADIEDGTTSNPLILTTKDQTTMSDDEIRQRILEQLPAGTKATISTETMTLKTVKVNIQGAETANIEAPPGMILVSEYPNFDNSSEGQTIIFRTASKIHSQAEVSRNENLRLAAGEGMDADDGGLMMTAVASSSHDNNRQAIRDHPAEESSSGVEAVGPSQAVQILPYGTTANQKKIRKAMIESSTAASQRAQLPMTPQPSSSKDKTSEVGKTDRPEKAGALKKALKSLTPASVTSNKNLPGPSRSRSNSGTGLTNSLSQTLRPLTSTRDPPRRPAVPASSAQSGTPFMSSLPTSPSGREGPTSNYFTVHERRRESTYSEVDTYSIHSNESHPPSPTISRAQLRATNSISKTKSSTEISVHQNDGSLGEDSSRHHRRSHSFVPSLYSMGTKNTEDEALILAPKIPMPRKSIFEDDGMLMALSRDGIVPGQFPKRHLIETVRRFVRFAIAAYGEYFLKIFGTMQEAAENVQKQNLSTFYHREIDSFAQYADLPHETIIKSSFLDVKGMENRYSKEFSTICHFVTIDPMAKAIVLTCRGTLGLEDLLTDMACDYVDLIWQGQSYKVHRGVRDAARRLIDGADGNGVMAVLKSSLDEFPEFGLVFVGHSLGGAVAALAAIMLSEPAKQDSGKPKDMSFVTANKPRLLPSSAHSASSKEEAPISLPPDRPIHVYAYGSPAIISASLRVATRGLITSIINANDTVPFLSLGTLHDFRAVATRVNEDISGAFSHIKQRASRRVVDAMADFLMTGHRLPAPPPNNFAGDGLGEDNWAWRELVEMRKVMTSEKLYPPGEIFILETTSVFDRTPDESTTAGAEQSKHYTPLGRPASRVQFKWVRDVETRFNEVRFGSNMFTEHTPSFYENALSALERGVCDEYN